MPVKSNKDRFSAFDAAMESETKKTKESKPDVDYSAFDAVMESEKKNGGGESQGLGSESTTSTTSPGLPSTIDDGYLQASEQWRYAEGMPTIPAEEPRGAVSLANSYRKSEQKEKEALEREGMEEAQFNEKRKSQYKRKLKEDGYDDAKIGAIMSEIGDIPAEYFEQKDEQGNKPYDTEYLSQLRESNYPYYLNRLAAIKNQHNLEKNARTKNAGNLLGKAWNESGMTKMDEFNKTDNESIVNNLGTLNKYTEEASNIITNSLGGIVMHDEADKEIETLDKGVDAYVDATVTPSVAKEYLQLNLPLDYSKLKYRDPKKQAMVDAGIEQPSTNIDDYTINSIKEQAVDLSYLNKRVLDKYADGETISDVLTSSPTIEEAAIEYAVKTDPKLEAQYQALGGVLPEKVKGMLVQDFLNNQSVIEYASDKPEVMQKLKDASYNITNNFPSYSKVVVLNKLGDAYMKKYGNWFANSPSVKELDDIVNDLRSSGQMSDAEFRLYKKEIVPQQSAAWKTIRALSYPIGGALLFKETTPPTAGFVEGFGEGLGAVESGLAKTVEGTVLQTTPAAFLFDDQSMLSKAMANGVTTQIDPNGVGGTAYQMGNATGFFAGMAMAGVPVGALGVTGEAAHLMSTAMAFYGDNRERAMLEIPGSTFSDNIKRTALTNSYLAVDLGLSKVLDFDKFGKNVMNLLKNDILTSIKKLGTKGITEETVKKEITQKIKDFALRYGKTSVKTAAAMNAYGTTKDMVDNIFTPNGKEMSDIMDEYVDNFIPTLKSVALISLINAAAPNASMTTTSLYDMAKNKGYYLNMIERLSESNPDIKKNKQEYIDNLNRLGKIYEQYSDPSFNNINEKQKGEMLVKSAQAEIYAEKAANASDPVAKKRFEDEAKRLHMEIDEIVNKATEPETEKYYVEDKEVTKDQFIAEMKRDPNQAFDYTGDDEGIHKMLRDIGGQTEVIEWDVYQSNIPQVSVEIERLTKLSEGTGAEAEQAKSDLEKLKTDTRGYFEEKGDADTVTKIDEFDAKSAEEVVPERTVEETESELSNLPEEVKMEYIDGNTPIMGNEKLIAQKYQEAKDTPEDQRTEEQNQLIQAVDDVIESNKVSPEMEEDVTSFFGVEGKRKKGQPVAPVVVSEGKEMDDLAARHSGNRTKSVIIEAAKSGARFIKSILPDLEIHIHEDEASYNDMMRKVKGLEGTAGNIYAGRDANGKYSGRIDINLSRANARTVGHEIAHAVLGKVFGDNPKMFNKFRTQISKTLSTSNLKDLNEFAESYASINKKVIPEEFLAELAGALSAKQVEIRKIDPTILQKIAEIVNNIVMTVTNGKYKPFTDVKDIEAVAEFFKTIAEGVSKGEAITEERLREFSEPLSRKQVIYGGEVSAKVKSQVNDVFNGILDKLGIGVGAIDKKTGKRKKPTNFDVAKALNEYYTKQFKLLKVDDFSDKALDIVSDYAADEVIFAIERNGNNSGKGWYTTDYEKALDNLSKLDPRITKDPALKEAATVAIAISSNSSDVLTNLIRIVYGVNHFAENGKLPTDIGTGKAMSAIATTIDRYNRLLDKFGGDVGKLKEFLQTIRTVSESKQAIIDLLGVSSFAKVKELDYATDPEWDDAEVLPTSVIIFGPKIGAFYSNLSGLGGTPTIDRWCIRTMYRYRGDMRSKILPESLDQFAKANGVEGQSKGSILSLAESHWNMFNAILTGRKEFKGLSKDERNKLLKPYRLGHTIIEMNYGVVNDIKDGLTPKIENKAKYGRDFRTFTKKTFESVKEKVKEKTGEDLTISDIQAILWIYEKELFGYLGVKQREDATYSSASKRILDAINSGEFSIDDLKNGKVTGLKKGITQEGVMQDGAMGDIQNVDPNLYEQGLNSQPNRISQDIPEAENKSQFNEKEKPIFAEQKGEYEETIRPESGRERTGREESSRFAPLEGAPSVPGVNGADPQLVAVAEKYATDNGIKLKRQSEYAKVDVDRAKRIAEEYEKMKHDPQDPRVKEAYQNLIKQTIAQYEALVNAGYKFWFIDTNIPSNIEYASTPYNALRDARQNKTMGVFPTTDGFGSNEAIDVSDNPLMAETGFYWSVGGLDGKKKPVLANDLFRAVHDMFGHGLEGAGFRARGEENAWQAHIRLYTGSAIGAITSETRGQNSWLNFGRYGETNRTAKVEDTIFADQKTGLMPEWTWTEGRVGDMEEVPSGKKSKPQILGESGASRLRNAKMVVDNLGLAKELERSGKDPLEIRIATGWERGKDGMWRIEIPDGKLKDFDINSFPVNKDGFHYAKLKDILDYPELFEAYSAKEREDKLGEGRTRLKGFPTSIEDITVVFNKYLPAGNGSWDYRNNTIELSTKPNDLFPVLIHELQHVVQDREGFEEGSHPEQSNLFAWFKSNRLKQNVLDAEKALTTAKELAKDDQSYIKSRQKIFDDAKKEYESFEANIDKVRGDGYELYKRVAGETEARNASARMNMTPEERRFNLLSSTEDIAREDQVLLNDDLGFPRMSVTKPEAPTGKKSKASLAEDKVKEFIDSQRKKGKSDSEIKKALYAFASKLGLTKARIDELLKEKPSVPVPPSPSVKKEEKQEPEGTGISKGALAEFGFSKEFESRDTQGFANGVLGQVKAEAEKNNVSVNDQIKANVDVLKGTADLSNVDKDRAIITAGARLLQLNNLIKEAVERGDDGAVELLEKERNEVATILRQFGNSAGRTLALFNMVFKDVTESDIVVARSSIAKSLGVSDLPESIEEWEKSELTADDKERVKKYVEIIEGLKKSLAKAEKKSTSEVNKISKDQLKAKLAEAYARGLKKGKESVEAKEKKRQERDKKIDDFFDNLKIKGGNTYTVVIPPKVWNLAMDGLKLAAKSGVKAADAINDAIKVISEAVGDNWDKEKFKSDFLPYMRALEKGKDVSELSAVSIKEKIAKIASKEKEGTITKSMVDGGLIAKLFDAYIRDGVAEDKIIDAITNDLKSALPNVTKSDVTDAFLRRNNYKVESKNTIDKRLAEKKAAIRTIVAKEEKLRALEAGDAYHNQDSKEKKDRFKSDYEKSLDSRINDALENKKKIEQEKKEKEREVERAAAELKRQREKIAELNKKLDDLSKGVLPETEAKAAPKPDTPEIEALKAKVKKAEADLRESINKQNREKERLADLNKKLADLIAGVPAVKKGKPAPESPAIEAVKKQIKDLKEQMSQQKRETERIQELTNKLNALLAGRRPAPTPRPTKVESPAIEALKQQIKDADKALRQQEAIVASGIRQTNQLNGKLSDIQNEIDYVNQNKKVFQKAISSKSEASQELKDARAALEKAYVDAGLRRERDNTSAIGKEQAYQDAVDKIESDPSLSSSEKQQKIKELKELRDAELKGTRQGVINALVDDLSAAIDALNSKGSDAVSNDNDVEADYYYDLASSLESIVKNLTPSGENMEDMINKAYAKLNEVMESKIREEDANDIDRIITNLVNNNQTTVDQIASNRLKQTWQNQINSDMRAINSGIYSTIPATKYEYQREEALSILNRERQNVSGRLKALKADAKNKEKGLVDKIFDLSTSVLVSGVHTAAKVLEAATLKPFIDSVVETTFGRIASVMTNTSPTSLRAIKEGLKTFVAYKNKEAAMKDIASKRKAKEDALVALEDAYENGTDADIKKAEDNFKKADILYAMSSIYADINSNALSSIWDYLAYTATDYDQNIGKGLKKDIKDYRTAIEKIAYVVDGWVRTHSAMKSSISGRPEMMRSFVAALEGMQKEGELTPDRIAMAMVIAANSFEYGRMTNKTAMSKFISSAKSHESRFIKYVTKTLFPVATVAANIAKRGIDYSTLGVEGFAKLGNEIKKSIKLNDIDGKTYDTFIEKLSAAINRIPLEKRAYINGVISRGMFGAAMGMVAMYALQNGMLRYGGTWDDKRKRKVKASDGTVLEPNQWEIAGWKAPKAFSAFLNHTPEFLPLSLIANTYQINNIDAEDSDKLKNTLNTNIQEIEGRFPFMTMGGLFKDPSKTIVDRFTRVPLAHEAAAAIDEKAEERETKGLWNTFLKNTGVLQHLRPLKSGQYGEKYKDSKGVKYFVENNIKLPKLPDVDKIKVTKDKNHPNGLMTDSEKKDFTEKWIDRAVKYMDAVSKEVAGKGLTERQIDDIEQMIPQITTRMTHIDMAGRYTRFLLNGIDDVEFRAKLKSIIYGSE